MRRVLTVLGLSMALVGTALIAEAAPGDAGLNARLIRWQKSDAIVHLFPQTDAGNSLSGTTAYVPAGKKLLFGFEYIGGTDQTLEDFETFIAGLTMTVRIDGAPPIDVSSSFLEIFWVDGSGPRWSWDHDADGPGDADGDGIGDFPIGWLAPFRYAHRGLAEGPHTFVFEHSDSGGVLFTDTITFEMTS